MNTTSAALPRSASTSVVWPIVLILIGILALALPVATSFGVARVLSWLLFFDGIVQFFDAFKSEGVGRILWKVVVALLYVAGGIYLLLNPLVGMAGFTLMLAVVFCVEGIMDLTDVLVRFEEQRGALALSAWHCDTGPRRDDLAPMAAEFTLGGGDPCRRQHPVKWGDPPSSCIGHSPTARTPSGLIAAGNRSWVGLRC